MNLMTNATKMAGALIGEPSFVDAMARLRKQLPARRALALRLSIAQTITPCCASIRM